MVTHIYDPDHFHCVLDGMLQRLDQTMDQLHEHYSKLQAGQEALSNPTLGTPCVAQYSADMDWYRAKITSLLSNGLAEVMFVDYGNNECLSKDLLKAIKPDFMILPAQAILCGLADVSASQGFWSPEHIAQFEDLVLEQSFQATFRSHVVARDQPYIVNLVNKKGEEINRIFGRSTDSLCVDVASSSKRMLSTNNNTIQVNVQSDDWEDDSSRSNNFGSGGRSYGDSRFGSGEGRGGRSSGFNKGGDRDSFVKVGFGHDSGRGSRGGFGQNRNEDEGDGFGKSGRFKQDHKEEHFKRRHHEDEKGGFGGAGLSKDNNQSRMRGTWAASDDGNGRDRSGFTKVGAGHKGGSDDSSSDSSFGSGRRQFRQRSDGDSGKRGFGNKDRHSHDGDSRRSGFRNDRFGGKSDDGESNSGDSGEFRRSRFGGEKGGTFGGERSSFRGGKRGGHFSQGGNGDNRESGRGFGGKPGGGRRGFSDRSEGGFGGKSGRGFGGKSGGGFSGKSGGGFGGTSTVERGFGAASSGGDDWDSEVAESKSHPHGFGVSSGGQAGGAVMSRGFGSQTSQEESWEGGGNATICGLKITPPKQRFRGVSIKEEEAYVHYKLKLMETADVYVVYNDSPSKFWCQVVKNSTDLQNLMDEINEEYERENLLEELQLKEPKPGMPCAAKFSDDNMWYRGEIKKCSTSGEEVHFVDYGNTETVCLSSIRKLKPKFLHLPTQGLKCVLDKVSPSGGQWTDKAIEEFENLTADRKLFLKVLNTSADSAHMVMLENQEENIDITQILIEKGYCTLPTDAAAKKIVSFPYPSLNLPLGTTTDVYVSWIENPHRFWCQPVSEENTLDKVAETLQEQYNSGIGANLTVQSAIPGMAVVSLFSEDGAWYRAMVEAVAGDSVQVQFVDYGNTDTVKLESLRRITEDLLQIHSLAAVCKLTGLRPLQSGWTVDAKDIMKQLVEDKRVSCKVLDKEEDCLLVELMVEGTNMGEELIRAAVVRADKEPSSVVGSAMLKSEVIYTRQGMKRYPTNSSLDIGSSYSGYVAYVESISSFWCQLLSGSDELNALMQKLESFHNSMNQSLDKLEVGSACVAKYSEDQAWYRGRVDKVDSEGVTIFFVDYGNKEVISTSDVCTIWDEFLTLPTQAIHCSLQLSNVKCNPEMSKKLEELVMDQVLTIRSVKVNNDVYEIVLTLQDGTCVNDIFSSTAEKELSTDLASKYAMISYPKATYPTDKNIKVYLSYMESPSKFYVQLATQEDELNELMGKLKDTYSEEKQNLSQGMPGLACTAKFSDDGEWYRAEVIESHDTTLKLRFVDYGNCEETSLDLVKILASEFVDIQPLAFQCCLQELDPIGEEWSSETITEFEALTFDKELTCNFNSLGQVRLQSEDGDIGEMLVNKGHAKWRISSNICALDKTATSESSKESLLLVKEGEQALKEELLQQAESDKSNENAAMEEPEGKAETEWTFLSEESQLRMVCLEEGQRQTIVVSHCESPSLFWIQLESNKPSIDTLLNSMFDAYSDHTLATLYVDKVQEGDLVVALHADDESWYRAKVISVASDQEVEVFFMDYGNSEIVPKDSLRKFMAQFSELPIQGLKCSLTGVNPKGNSWSDETIDLFTELTQDKPLLMDVLSVKDEVYQVELMNMGLSIGQQLLDQGDAVEKEYVPLFNKRVHQLFASDSSTPSKPQKEKQFRYKELDLDPKSGTFEVLLSHLTNPGDFWCQKLDYQKGMTELDTRIQDSYSSDSETITGIVTHLGCVILNTEDNKYYRGVVQKVNDKSVIVLCIDNGSEIQVPSENVKKLKSEFMDLPQQAFHCGLSDIISESLNGTWDVGACNRFHELVDSKPVKAELARHDCYGKYLLKLYDGDVSIAQALVDGGYARFRGVLPMVDKGGYKQLRLEVDDEYEVTLVDNDEMDKLVFHVLSQVDVIKGITERVAETVKEMEKTETKLNEGDLCLVLNKSSDTWYRGVVQEKVDGQYEVYTLDYGSVMTVEAAQIMPLSKSLVSIPAQALICSMEDIIPEQNTTWTEESIDFFKEYCTEGRLFLYVSSYEDGVHHVVLSKEEAKGSVNALLVDLGFATAIPGSDIDLEVQEEHGEESFMELSLCRANSLGSINEETTTDLEETATDREESVNASMLKSDMPDDCILSESAVSFTLSEEDLDSGLKQKGTGSFSSKLEASTPYQQTRHAVGELNSEEAIDDSSCPLEQDYCRTVASTMQDSTDGKVILISSNQYYTEASNDLDNDQQFIQFDLVVEEPDHERFDINSHHTKSSVNFNVSSIQEQLDCIDLTGNEGCMEVEDVLLSEKIKTGEKEAFIDITSIGSYVEIGANSDDVTTCVEVCESLVMLNKTGNSKNKLDEGLKTMADNMGVEIKYSVDRNKETHKTGVEDVFVKDNERFTADFDEDKEITERKDYIQHETSLEGEIVAKDNEHSTTGFDEVKSTVLTERKDNFQHENELASFIDNVGEESFVESDLDKSDQHNIYRSPTGYTTSELDTTELAEVETDTEENSSFLENGQESTGVAESESGITGFTDCSIDTTGLSGLSFDQDMTDRKMEDKFDFTGLDSIDTDLEMTDTATEDDNDEDESDMGKSSDGTAGADRWKDRNEDFSRSNLFSNLSSQDTVENSDEHKSAATDQDSITDCSSEVADQRVTTNKTHKCYCENTVEKSMVVCVDKISCQNETDDPEAVKDMMTRNKDLAENLGMIESSSESVVTDSSEMANSYLCKKAKACEGSNTLTETREIYLPEEEEAEKDLACDPTDHETVVCMEHADNQTEIGSAEGCAILTAERKSGSIEISARIVQVAEDVSNISTQSYDSVSALQRSPTSGYIAGESKSNIGVEPADVSSYESFFTAEASEDLVGDLSQGNTDSDDNIACHRDGFFVCENCRHEFSSTLETTGCSSDFSFYVCESCQSIATTEESYVRSSYGDYTGMEGGVTKGGNLMEEYSPNVCVDDVFATSSPAVELVDVDFVKKDFNEDLIQPCEDKTESSDSKIDVVSITESQVDEQVSSEKGSCEINNNNSISQDTANITLFEEVKSPVAKMVQSVQNRIEACLHNFEKCAQGFLASEPDLKYPDPSIESNDGSMKETEIKIMKSDTVSTNVNDMADSSEADKTDISIQFQEHDKSTLSSEPEEKFDLSVYAANLDTGHNISTLSTDKVHETDAGIQVFLKDDSRKTGQDSDTVKTGGYEKCPDFGVTKEHLDQGATKEDLDQGVKKEHPDQGITREDLDQGVTKEHLEQGVTKEHLDQGVTKECLDQYVTKEYLEECVTQDHKLEFPECKADKDVCSDGPKYSQDERGKQAGDNGMPVELLVVESQDSIHELDNDGQQPLDSVLTENVEAIDDTVAKEEDAEKESKDAFEMDIVDESTSKGTEDDGNRMGYVDVCQGIVLEKAKVQEDPGITNKEKKDVENTTPALTPNHAKLDEMQSTGTEIDRDENSESWFDAKEG